MGYEYTLEVAKREKVGKGEARRLRAKGFVPGVYYAKNGENFALQVPYASFLKIVDKAFRQSVVELKIESQGQVETRPVLIWDYQTHPTKSLYYHVDFLGIDPNEPIEVDVPIEVSGVSKGAEMGGEVAIYRDSLLIKCLPTKIPEKIVVDITNLDINDNVLVNDLELPEGISIKESEENFAVLGIVAPGAEEEEEIEEAAEEEVVAEEAE